MKGNVLGIDVSKRKFDVALQREDGNSRLRRALWWPAIVAMRHNPLLAAFAQRLREAGKPTKVIIAAVMRKLVQLAFGVLKHHRRFDPNYHPLPT